MIAANNGGSDEEKSDGESDKKPPEINGGHMGGAQPNLALNDLRCRADANRLAKLVAAGEVAAEHLKALAEKVAKRIARKCTDRDLAALGKLQLAIATAADKQGTTINNFNGPTQLQVVYSDDWYGSKAANLAATDAASNGGAVESQPVQDSGVRPSLGEDGGSVDRSNRGAR